MVKLMLRAVFGCGHGRTTFPLTPTSRRANAVGSAVITGAYVVCLDCGKEFAYDWARMRIGEPVRKREPLATEQQVHTFVG
jgi:hypothetical protein